MTNRELSEYFDTLVANHALGVAAFDEYEKSLFLTDAQEELVVSLYRGTINSFESTEEMRRSLAPLVKEYIDKTPIATPKSFGGTSYVYELQDDVWFLVYESVEWTDAGCLPNKNVEVVPVSHDEYHRIKNNPFRGANNNRVLRFDCILEADPIEEDTTTSTTENTDSIEDTGDIQTVELVSKYKIAAYRYRYLRKPNPIILENLDENEGITIDGKTKMSKCELPERLHKPVVELAVQKALATRANRNTNS